MNEECPDWTDEEKARLDALLDRYPANWTEYRLNWYRCKMKQDELTVDFIERFLAWNNEYITRREAILAEWPSKIPKGMVLELCHRAIVQNPDQLMCTPQSFFNWLKANGYLVKRKRYWQNDCSNELKA